MKNIYILANEGLKGTSGVSRMINYLSQETKGDDYFHHMKYISATNGLPLPLWIFYFIYSVLKYLISAFRGKIALLHINIERSVDTYRSLFFFYFSAMFCIPVVIQVQDSDFLSFYKNNSNFTKSFIDKMFQLSKNIIVLDRISENSFIDELNIDEEKIVILENAIPDPKVENKTLSKDYLKFLFLGHLEQEKGIDILITAFSKLKDKNWHLTIAGSGDTHKYKKVAKELDILDKMEFTGTISHKEVQELLKSADIFVFPYLFETFPIFVIEAMAYKLAVISTSVSMIPEFAIDGENSLIVPPNDVDELTKALKQLLEQPLSVRKIGDAGYETFKQKFEIKSYKKRILEMYSEILGFI